MIGYISYLSTMITQSNSSRVQGSQPLCLLRRRCLRKDPPAGPLELESDAHARQQHGGPLRLRRARSPLGHLRSVHEARWPSTAGPLPDGLRLAGAFDVTLFDMYLLIEVDFRFSEPLTRSKSWCFRTNCVSCQPCPPASPCCLVLARYVTFILT